MQALRITVNGREVDRLVEARTHLADFLREDLHLTGTHIGCEHGVCGACTLMVDGRPTRSCITFAAACRGAEVRTVESFADDAVMSALREAFSRRHALQCGYCTPGFLATAYDIVTRLPAADEARIREELAGNLCRCTGYMGIVAAIADVLRSGVGGQAPMRPIERPDPEPGEQGVVAVPTAGSTASTGTKEQAAGSRAALPPLPATLVDPVRLSSTIEIAAEPDALWTVLRDIETVARCLPGAIVEEKGDDGHVVGAMAVAIGPMQARFAGHAKVTYDDAARSGSVIGSGGDRISRSRADGQIRFAVAPTETRGRQRLDVEIAYKLSGPLSQFGRPAVVADIVERLLGQFARNLADAAEGREIAVGDNTLGGFSLAAAALSSMLRRLFSRSS